MIICSGNLKTTTVKIKVVLEKYVKLLIKLNRQISLLTVSFIKNFAI